MLDSDIEKKKQAFAVEKTRIAQRERRLQQKIDKKRIGKFIGIGKLCFQAGIDSLGDEILLGAFLEIAARARDEKNLNAWKELGSKTLQTESQALIISFNEDLSEDITTVLKENKFRWIPFRKEWHGRAVKEEMERRLEGKKVKIEVVT